MKKINSIQPQCNSIWRHQANTLHKVFMWQCILKQNNPFTLPSMILYIFKYLQVEKVSWRREANLPLQHFIFSHIRHNSLGLLYHWRQHASSSPLIDGKCRVLLRSNLTWIWRRNFLLTKFSLASPPQKLLLFVKCNLVPVLSTWWPE